MKLTFKYRSAILMFCAASLAWGDQVILKNGDRITGAIVKKENANLMMSGTRAGKVTIPWDEVTAINSDGPLTVVLAGGKSVQTPLSMSNGQVMVQGQRVGIGDIVAIRDAEEEHIYGRLLKPSWGQLWAGNASLSFAGTQGNAETKTFVTAATVARITNSDKTSLYFNAIKSSATIDRVNSDTAEAVRGGWAYSHNLRSKLFVNIFNDWEYDKFQDLDLRFVLGGGLGYHLWKSDKGQLDVVGGVDYARDKFGAIPNTDPTLAVLEHTDSRAELYYGDDFNYKMNAQTSLTQSFRMFHNFSDFGAYRINLDVGANTKLTRWLTWNVGLSDRYLANPVLGRKPNDFIYSTGIGVTFAR